MSWFKIDDKHHDHSKTRKALYLRCWHFRQLSKLAIMR